MKKKRNYKRHITLKGVCRLFVCMVAVILLAIFLLKRQIVPKIPENSNEAEGFRQMYLTEDIMGRWHKICGQAEEDPYYVLAVLMAASGFGEKKEEKTIAPKTVEEYDKWKEYYQSRQEEELSILAESYKTILADLVYFPVMKNSKQASFGISYADSWYAERAYQDTTHAHEGTDIMALNNERGYYPIVSMTDGVVENIGWLEKGGYRIGVRSPHGAYFYYAHLYRYAEGIKKGDIVKAGQLLGFMGDSGYSKVEGTVGNFDVHLHLGIYLKTEHFEELSVNPYWILRQMDSKVLQFSD